MLRNSCTINILEYPEFMCIKVPATLSQDRGVTEVSEILIGSSLIAHHNKYDLEGIRLCNPINIAMQ